MVVKGVHKTLANSSRFHERSDRRLTFKEAAGFITEFADAPDHAHGDWLADRKIKQANIMIDCRRDRYELWRELLTPSELDANASVLVLDEATWNDPRWVGPTPRMPRQRRALDNRRSNAALSEQTAQYQKYELVRQKRWTAKD
jgi:hypothetical protein